MNYIIKMLSQPSTYAGFATIALALGVSSSTYEVIAKAAAGVFGLIAVLVHEGTTPIAGD